MRFLLLLALASCSCAHGKQVTFTDNSQDDEIGWVCVPDKGDSWKCVSISTFADYLRDAEQKKPADM